jgi:cell pole-organizing protein PopZ
MRHESEPSVEEILASIKKVIARDNRDFAEGERLRREKSASAAAPEEDVLELGAEAELVESEPEALIPEETRSSMQESFAALAMLSDPGVPPQIVRSGETSLEGLTREMLRPMLAEWLDKNLPGMVERLVAAEIARIAGKKG